MPTWHTQVDEGSNSCIEVNEDCNDITENEQSIHAYIHAPVANII